MTYGKIKTIPGSGIETNNFLGIIIFSLLRKPVKHEVIYVNKCTVWRGTDFQFKIIIVLMEVKGHDLESL